MYTSKRWLLPDFNIQDARRMSDELNISLLAAKVLCARGFDLDKASRFINVDDSFFYDPFLLNDMQKAVDRINIALQKKEKIAVYGDYDVDGITSTYVMYDYLKSLDADVLYYIPDRISEGYGMNQDAIDTLKAQGVGLIITVDLGITATNEVEYAKAMGIDVIITDHHELKETLPNAVAVINPKITTASYPFDSLAGVGVAFKLIYAHSHLVKKIFSKYCDIVAIGTIADMVPLCDENRYIASVGISALKNVQNKGIKSIMTIAGISKYEISSSDISFAIAPRLNAAGRMSRAQSSVELLLECNDSIALELAEKLDLCNKERQKEEQKIFEESLEIIEAQNLNKDAFILVGKEGWANGVIGIVSSKITDMYYKPSAVVSINSDGSAKASGRSIKGINLFDCLSHCSDTLIKFGGHELAAGFTLDTARISDFHKKINEYISPKLTEEILTPSLEVDCVLDIEDITLESVHSLCVLEPYGIENKSPLFCIEDLTIDSVRYTQNRKHAFVTVSKAGITQEFPAFSMAERIKNFTKGEVVSVVGSLSTNSFRGVVKPQFIIKDIKYSDKARKLTLDELKIIFADIRNKLNDGITHFENETPVMLECRKKTKFHSPKIQTAVKILNELDILFVEKNTYGYTVTKGVNFDGKTDLNDSATFVQYVN